LNFHPHPSIGYLIMKKTLKITALPICLLVAFSGCANLTPGENAAIAGGVTGLAVGLPLALSGVNPAVTIPVTAGAAIAAAGGTYLISRNQASQRQRLQAQERASEYVARTGMDRKKSVRYLAVRTESERQRSTTQVMIYDIETSRIVNNVVYDMRDVPPVGQVGDFDGFRALYIGTGR
jgi:hypothetical protein